MLNVMESRTISFLFGAAIGVLGAFGAGFFKKAGEDLYSFTKKKLNPKLVEPHPPQLVVQINIDKASADHNRPSMALELAALERISLLKFEEVKLAIESAPPLQRDSVANRYVGLRVDWDTIFRSGWQKDKDKIALLLAPESNSPLDLIKCEVAADEYRELGILRAGSKIRVSGEIARATAYDMELKDVRLQIYGDHAGT